MARTISVRIDDDINMAVDKWLQKNPDLTLTIVTNMALRKFITQEHTLEPVKTFMASKKEVDKLVENSMEEHKDMLERLK